MVKFEAILRKVAELFSDDPSVPSVTCAWIESKQHFYGSIVRYTEAFGRGKSVVFKCDAPSADGVLDQLCEAVGVTVATP